MVGFNTYIILNKSLFIRPQPQSHQRRSSKLVLEKVRWSLVELNLLGVKEKNGKIQTKKKINYFEIARSL